MPWDHTNALAYPHIMAMDEFAQVKRSLKIKRKKKRFGRNGEFYPLI